MSHIHRRPSFQEQNQKTISTPTSQPHSAAERNDTWWVIDPPRLNPAFLFRDLRERWTTDFSGAGMPKKLAFSALRLIQHLAYRKGYGGDVIRAVELPSAAPSFTRMERNLEQVAPAFRLAWLQEYLAWLNVVGAGNAEAADGDEQDQDRPTAPSSVVFELSHTCNFSCVGCGVGEDGIQLGRTMPVAQLRRWCAELEQQPSQVRINGLGEATLHPDLLACLDVLEPLGGDREVITNFSAPLDIYLQLLDRRYVILISWDACTPERFEAIRRGAQFADLRWKLSRLAAAARKRQAPEPLLLFTLRPDNLDELAGTILLAGASGIRRLTVNVFKRADELDWTATDRDRILEGFAAAGDVAQREGVQLVLPDHLGEEPVNLAQSHRCSVRGCAFPWTQVVIRHNGSLTPCNMMNPYEYGSLAHGSFHKAWAGPEARTFRAMTNTKRRHPFCRGCYYVDPLRRSEQ